MKLVLSSIYNKEVFTEKNHAAQQGMELLNEFLETTHLPTTGFGFQHTIGSWFENNIGVNDLIYDTELKSWLPMVEYLLMREVQAYITNVSYIEGRKSHLGFLATKAHESSGHYDGYTLCLESRKQEDTIKKFLENSEGGTSDFIADTGKVKVGDIVRDFHDRNSIEYLVKEIKTADELYGLTQMDGEISRIPYKALEIVTDVACEVDVSYADDISKKEPCTGVTSIMEASEGFAFTVNPLNKIADRYFK